MNRRVKSNVAYVGQLKFSLPIMLRCISFTGLYKILLQGRDSKLEKDGGLSTMKRYFRWDLQGKEVLLVDNC